MTDNGVQVFSRSFTSLAGTPLAITGSHDNDTLTIDFSGGNPIPAAGLAYDGSGPGDFDTLALTGGSPASVIYGDRRAFGQTHPTHPPPITDTSPSRTACSSLARPPTA